eukprot:4674618-Prymnesium_polylepis.1
MSCSCRRRSSGQARRLAAKLSVFSSPIGAVPTASSSALCRLSPPASAKPAGESAEPSKPAITPRAR